MIWLIETFRFNTYTPNTQEYTILLNVIYIHYPFLINEPHENNRQTKRNETKRNYCINEVYVRVWLK